MYQTVFNVVATLLFMWLALIWVKTTTYNALLKFIFILMTIYGLLICLKDFGFLVKL